MLCQPVHCRTQCISHYLTILKVRRGFCAGMQGSSACAYAPMYCQLVSFCVSARHRIKAISVTGLPQQFLQHRTTICYATADWWAMSYCYTWQTQNIMLTTKWNVVTWHRYVLGELSNVHLYGSQVHNQHHEDSSQMNVTLKLWLGHQQEVFLWRGENAKQLFSLQASLIRVTLPLLTTTTCLCM